MKISLEGIKVTYLSKPRKPCKQPTLFVSDTELEGVLESCHPRRSRATWPDVESIDRDSEAQTKEVTVPFGERVVEPAWL